MFITVVTAMGQVPLKNSMKLSQFRCQGGGGVNLVRLVNLTRVNPIWKIFENSSNSVWVPLGGGLPCESNEILELLRLELNNTNNLSNTGQWTLSLNNIVSTTKQYWP